MPGKKKNGGNGGKGPWGQIRLGSFKAEFPQPRIPRLIGSDTALSARDSVYPPRVKLDVPLSFVVQTIAAGALAAVIPIDTTAVTNWVEFAALFKEYAIVGARLELRPNAMATTSGYSAAYLDETSNAAPTASSTLQNARVDMLNAPVFRPGGYHITWTPRDILDLDYVATGTNFTPVYLKLFTDVANFGSNVATTGQWIITGSVAFEFRGYN